MININSNCNLLAVWIYVNLQLKRENSSNLQTSGEFFAYTDNFLQKNGSIFLVILRWIFWIFDFPILLVKSGKSFCRIPEIYMNLLMSVLLYYCVIFGYSKFQVSYIHLNNLKYLKLRKYRMNADFMDFLKKNGTS